MDNSNEDDFSDALDDESLWSKFKGFIKLLIILSAYSFVFISTVQLGLWLAPVKIQDFNEDRTILEWVSDVFNQRDWKDRHITSLIMNLCLIIIFGFQHTLMSRRNLQGTYYWDLIHFTLHIDKPIYLFFTGLSLQAMKYFWRPIPLVVWTIDSWTEGYVGVFYVLHVIAWVILYGTSLMLDLPEMIGLTQVAINSPTITAKSNDLQSLHIKQRHMGLIPLIVILLAFPQMCLDRFLLTVGTMYYMNRQWRSYTCYEYTRNMKQVKKYSM